jgi:hypothetical protein
MTSVGSEVCGRLGEILLDWKITIPVSLRWAYLEFTELPFARIAYEGICAFITIHR